MLIAMLGNLCFGGSQAPQSNPIASARHHQIGLISQKTDIAGDTAYVSLVFQSKESCSVEHAILFFEYATNGTIEYGYTDWNDNGIRWEIGDNARWKIDLATRDKPQEYCKHRSFRISKEELFDIYRFHVENKQSSLMEKYGAGTLLSLPFTNCCSYAAKILSKFGLEVKPRLITTPGGLRSMITSSQEWFIVKFFRKYLI